MKIYCASYEMNSLNDAMREYVNNFLSQYGYNDYQVTDWDFTSSKVTNSNISFNVALQFADLMNESDKRMATELTNNLIEDLSNFANDYVEGYNVIISVDKVVYTANYSSYCWYSGISINIK